MDDRGIGMALDWLAMFKVAAGSIWKKCKEFGYDWYSRRKAGLRAMTGEDLASRGSLRQLVEIELRRLAARRRLPPRASVP